MNGFKKQLQSRTVIFAIVAILAGAAQLAGYVISPADQTALADLIVSLITIGSGAGAWWGRVKATKLIK